MVQKDGLWNYGDVVRAYIKSQAKDLFEYWRHFVHGGIYDPVTFELLRASKLIK